MGYGRVANAIVKEVVVAIDQSGSMAESWFTPPSRSHPRILRSIKNLVVAFDTEIADRTDKLSDPSMSSSAPTGRRHRLNRALANAAVDHPADGIDLGIDFGPLRGRHC